ncbi:hypothetical protein XENOCAPTIV_016532, partial [Xenoophorus captivus]
ADSSTGLELTRNTETLSEHSPESWIIPAGKPSGETSQLSEPCPPSSAICLAPPYQPLWMKTDCSHLLQVLRPLPGGPPRSYL